MVKRTEFKIVVEERENNIVYYRARCGKLSPWWYEGTTIPDAINHMFDVVDRKSTILLKDYLEEEDE